MQRIVHEPQPFEDERGQVHSACACGWEAEHDFHYGDWKWARAYEDHAEHVRSLAD